MAVVFISPKQRQRMFIIAIAAVFLVIMIAISLGVFMSKPKEVSNLANFSKPKVIVNMSIFDSDEFKILKVPEDMNIRYSYKANDQKGKQQIGYVAAVSEAEAKKYLEDKGWKVLELKEIEPGRDNPFTPYYQAASVSSPASTETNVKTSQNVKTSTK